MSLTRKCLDRKHLMSKLEQVKLDISGELMKSSLGQTVKKEILMARKSKSREKTVKLAQRTSSLREPSAKNRSKESRESRESLLKSTHSYYIAHRKSKRDMNEKLLKSYKSKEITNTSNPINSTFEMQSFASTHKKKTSNFSSIAAPKCDQAQVHVNKSAIHHESTKDCDALNQLLLRSETVLDQYKVRYQALQKQNKRYKKRYQQALKKIKNLQNKC